jgi:hypothetical protein
MRGCNPLDLSYALLKERLNVGTYNALVVRCTLIFMIESSHCHFTYEKEVTTFSFNRYYDVLDHNSSFKDKLNCYPCVHF